jgi:hypothetical protein
MNVISIKSSKKLVKGATYRVAYLNNQNTKSHNFFRPIVRIFLNDNSVESFPLSCFRTESGADFPNINWMSPEYQNILSERDQTKIDKTLKTGDYVVTKYDNLKTIVKGKKYKVKEVHFHDHKSSSGHVSWTDIKIKLEGSGRWYTDWHFRKCTQQEIREIGLKELFDEKSDTETVGRFKRKFDYLNSDEKITTLLKFIVESANDRYRNQMDIVEWAINKTGEKYSLKETDFDSIKSLTLLEILEILK